MGNLTLNGATSGQITISPPAVAGTNTLTLPAATGTVALTANPTFTGTVTATTITSPAATNLTIQSAGTTAMTIDTSQNVGIGTTSPSSYGTNITTLDVRGTSGSGIKLGTAANYGMYYNGGNGYLQTFDASPLLFASNNSERMRIDASGNWYLGTTTNLGKMTTIWNNSTQAGFAIYASTTTFSGSPIVFYNSSGAVSGYIGQSASTVAYNTSSDYRLKENVLPLTSGLTTISALKPVKHDWKIDGSHGEGFIAHELQEVIPHAVTGEKDAINKDGSIKPQGVDYSKIVVHLVAALQELKATVDAQAAEITALKVKVGV
jgi:hypothetical protein